MANDLDFTDPFESKTGKSASLDFNDPFATQPATVAKAPEEKTGDFMRGFKSTLPEMKQLVGGTLAAVGDVTGMDSVRDYGIDVFKRNQAASEELSKPTDSFTDAWGKVKQGDLGAGADFLQHAAGYVSGQALESLTAAGAGALAGSEVPVAGNVAGAVGGLVAKGAIKSFVKNKAGELIAEQLAKGVAKDVAEKVGAEYVAKQVGKTAAEVLGEKAVKRIGGAAIGTQAMNATMELGSVYPDAYLQAQKEGRDLSSGEKFKAVGASLAAAGLETVADLFNLGALFKGVKDIGQASAKTGVKQAIKDYAGRAAVAGGEGAIREAGTETAQTALERFGASKSLNDAEAYRDYIDSAAVGAVGGVLFGGAAALNKQESTPLGKDPADGLRANFLEAQAKGDVPVAELAHDQLISALQESGRVTMPTEQSDQSRQQNEAFGLNLVKPKPAEIIQGPMGITMARDPSNVAPPVGYSPAPGLPNPDNGVLSRVVNIAAGTGALQSAQVQKESAIADAAAVEQEKASAEVQKQSQPTNSPFVDASTGEYFEPSDDDIKSQLSQIIDTQKKSNGKVTLTNDKLSSQWGIPVDRIRGLRNQLRDDEQRTRDEQRTKRQAAKAEATAATAPEVPGLFDTEETPKSLTPAAVAPAANKFQWTPELEKRARNILNDVEFGIESGIGQIQITEKVKEKLPPNLTDAERFEFVSKVAKKFGLVIPESQSPESALEQQQAETRDYIQNLNPVSAEAVPGSNDFTLMPSKEFHAFYNKVKQDAEAGGKKAQLKEVEKERVRRINFQSKNNARKAKTNPELLTNTTGQNANEPANTGQTESTGVGIVGGLGQSDAAPNPVASQSAVGEVASDVPTAAKIKPDANGLVTMKTINGDTHRVKQSDLDGTRTQIPTYTKDGKLKETIKGRVTVHRGNLHVPGTQNEARDALWGKELPLYFGRTNANNHSEEGFVSAESARKAVVKAGYDPKDYDIEFKKEYGGFLAIRKPQQENTNETQQIVPTEQTGREVTQQDKQDAVSQSTANEETNAKQVLKKGGLTVRMDGQAYPIDSLEDAQVKFQQWRDSTGVGASDLPDVDVINEAGEQVGFFSYNGRFFEGSRGNGKAKEVVLGNTRLSPTDQQSDDNAREMVDKIMGRTPKPKELAEQASDKKEAGDKKPAKLNKISPLPPHLSETINDATVPYGWRVVDSQFFSIAKNKLLGVFVSQNKGGVQVRTEKGELLWSGQPERIGNFVENFWGAFKPEKPTSKTTDSNTVAAGTHTDPGQKPEPVTASVINESLKQSAKKTTFNPAEARAWLLGEVDQAIAGAEKRVDAMERSGVVAESLGKNEGWLLHLKTDSMPRMVRSTEGQEEIARMKAAALKAIGTVVFDVPGDGRFTILNTKENLLSFREKVESNPGFKKPAKQSSLGADKTTSPTAMVREFLDDKEYLNIHAYTEGLGKPMMYGLEDGGNRPIAFALAEKVDIDGIDAFVGMSIDGDAPGRWAVTDNATGWAIGGNLKKGEGSKKEAVASAIARVKKAGGGEKINYESRSLREKAMPAADRDAAWLKLRGVDVEKEERNTAARAANAAEELTGEEEAKLAKKLDAISAVANEAQANTAKPDAPVVKQDLTTESKAKIEDFGETLTGARKHYAHAYTDKMKDAAELDIATQPLSKVWPEPDYDKLLEAGASPYVAAWVHAARDEIPTKPTKSWRLKGWVESVSTLRGLANKLLAGEITEAKLRETFESDLYKRLFNGLGGRVDLYQEVGHNFSLKGVRFGSHHYSLYRGESNVTKWTIENRAGKGSNWPTELAVGNTREEAIAQFKEKYANPDKLDQAETKKQTKFVIYSYPNTKKFVVGKKLGKNYIDLESFDDVKSARAYLSDNHDALVKKLATKTKLPSERRATNEPRVGADHRTGGDVSPEQFSEAFGFRGVQFGNYVEGSRRQADLNRAYDALSDLAGVVGIPLKALSLNGTLGLAFGARGKGGKMAPAAHYESANVVINLTKTGGAGSLAHEWFHGLDNYFSRARNEKYGFVTDNPTSASTGIRPEMVKAFTRLMNAIKETQLTSRSVNADSSRSKPYFATKLEMAARSFESYVIAKLQDQNASNDYLANISSEAYWEAATELGLEKGGSYPYPNAGELPVIRAAFDDFFNTIQSEPTEDGKVRLFSKSATGNDSGSRISVAKVEATIAPILSKWTNGPRVTVLATTPANIDATAEGWYDPATGRVYLVASNLRDSERALEVLVHESIGHFGIEAISGPKEWAAISDIVSKMRENPKHADLFNELARRGYKKTDADFVKEAVAVMAEKGVRNSIIDRVMVAVRRWLRSIGFNAPMNDGDLRQYIVQAARFVETGSVNNAQVGMRRGGIAQPSYSARPDTFFSALAESIQTAKGAPKKGNSIAWKQWLDGAQRRGEFKQEERDWLGVDAWLSDAGEVTREQLNDFVRANQVQVTETLLGDPKETGEDSYREELEAMSSEDFSSEVEEILGIEADEDSLENRDDLIDEMVRAQQDSFETRLGENDTPAEVKFSGYQLPGGKNYRELLLTLPTSKSIDFQSPEFRAAAAEQYGEKFVDRLSDAQRELVARKMQGALGDDFKSSHYDQANILAHVRFNERFTTADGTSYTPPIRVLFIEEIQSDWHQKGRKEGYRKDIEDPNPDEKRMAALEQAEAALRQYLNQPGNVPAAWEDADEFIEGLSNESGNVTKLAPQGRDLGRAYNRANQLFVEGNQFRLAAMQDAQRANSLRAPDAPFKTSWPMLAFKRMTRYAADNGFDRIAWTTGEQQNERYDLSKQVDSISAARVESGLYSVDVFKNGNLVSQKNLGQGELDAFIGKDLADKIRNNDDVQSGFVTSFSGVDLQIGGEGMKGFYDKILPAEVNKFAKRFNGKVSETVLNTKPDADVFKVRDRGEKAALRWDVYNSKGSTFSTPFKTKEEAEQRAAEKNRKYSTSVHSLDITDSMRDTAREGLPMFSKLQSPENVAVMVLRALSKFGGFFRYGKSDKKTIEGVFADVAPAMKPIFRGTASVSFTEVEDDTVPAEKFEIQTADKKSAYIYVEKTGKGRMYLDAASLEAGQSLGSNVYSALFNYALNAGKVFIGDPNGLSDEALMRRTEHMLSAAIKFGTTKMMAPHPRQVQPLDGKWGKPQAWAKPVTWEAGNDVSNIAALVDSSYNNHAYFMRGTDGEQALYNFNDGRFEDRSGQALPERRLESIAQVAGNAFKGYPNATDPKSREAVIGRTTVARAILIGSILRGSGSNRRAELLGEIAAKLSTGSLDPALNSVMYSKQDPAAGGVSASGDVKISEKAQQSVRTVMDRIVGKLTDMKPALLGAIPLNYLVDYAPKGMPAVKQFIELRQTLEAFRNKKHQEFDAVAQDMLKYSTTSGLKGLLGSKSEQGKDLFDLMHDTTIAGVDPTLPASEYDKDPAKLALHTDLKKRYDAMPEEGQKLYATVRDAYAKQSKDIEDALEDNLRKAANFRRDQADYKYQEKLKDIRESGLSDAEKEQQRAIAEKNHGSEVKAAASSAAAKIIGLRQMFESMRVEQPYFPLKRFGKYFVSIRDDSGTSVAFSKFETFNEAKAFADEQAAKNMSSTIGLDTDKDAFTAAVDPRFIADVDQILAGMTPEGPTAGERFADGESMSSADAERGDAMRDIRDAIYQRYLETLPDLSLRKSFIHRKKTPGYNTDALRSFASTMFHGSYQLARLKYGIDMQAAHMQAEEQAKRVSPIEGVALANELGKRLQWVMNPLGGKFAQTLTTAAFVWHLGANPAHLFLNATQTIMLGMPILGSKYGFGRTSVNLTRAAGDFIKGKGHTENAALTSDEKRAMQAFIDSGLIDKTQAHDLAGVGDTGAEYSALRAKVMGKLGWFFHQSERFNREVTALAAYRLARESGKNHDAAMKLAAEHTWSIHFDYSAANRARYMQGDIAKVLTIFRNYNVNILYRLFRDIHTAFKGESKEAKIEASKQLGAMMGMYGLLAGITGMPFYGLVIMLAGMFDDDDEPFDAESRFMQGMVELLGEDAAGMLLKGVPAKVLDVEISSRIGMPNLWFRSPDRELEGQDAYYYWMDQIAGAGFAIPKAIFSGLRLVNQGHVERGVEAMLPNMAKSPVKAFRYAMQGQESNLDGDKLSDIGAGGTIAKALGFTPLTLTEQYEENGALKSANAKVLKRRQQIVNKYAFAAEQRDREGMNDALESMRKFNSTNIAYRITGDTLKRSMKMRLRNDALNQGGIVMTKRLQALANDRKEGEGR